MKKIWSFALLLGLYSGVKAEGVVTCPSKGMLKIPEIQGKIGFIQCGDIQWGSEGQKENKAGHVEIILQIVKGIYTTPDLINRTFIVVVPGDLIHGNSDRKAIQYASVLKNDPRNVGPRGMFKDFQQGFLKPLEEAGLLVLLLPGNHDYWDYTESALDFILQRHGRMYYAVDIGKDFFISCATWPDKQVVEWLIKTIEDKKKKNNGIVPPIVIAFHNNILGNHNECWSLAERDNFLDAIKDKNVQLIMHGHDHATYRGTVRGIPVVCSGGSTLPISLFDERGIYEKTLYFHAIKKDGSFVPKPVPVKNVQVVSLWTKPATKEEDDFRIRMQQLISPRYCGSGISTFLSDEISKYGKVALSWTDDQIDKVIDEKTQEFIANLPAEAGGKLIGKENMLIVKENAKALAHDVKNEAIKTVLMTAGKAEEVLAGVGLPAVDQILATTDFVTSVAKDPKKSLEAAKKYGESTVKTAQKIVDLAEKNAKDVAESAVKIGKDAEEAGKKAVKVLESGWKKTEEAAKKAGEGIKKGAEEVGKGIKKGAEEVGKGVKKGAEEVGKWLGL